MNGRYLYQVSDKVVHSDYPDIFGVITQLLSMDEGDPCPTLDPNEPWYHIEWDEAGSKWIGFEHEGSLLPYTHCMVPVKVMIYLFNNDPLLHKKLVDICK